ncbi:dihydrolipoamide acetyltransferase family protein [Sulfuricurvum sp.]|uniref:dihydrolipoamide acetyltransferase family protein n=1 Tax=Sulfuricurvum sp. TaxID=2025608 RepID=UPI003C565A1E
MSTFVMPSLGADMESAVLMEWKVKEGDSVAKGDVIAEVETSKGVIEIEVFEDGIVEKLLVEEETECGVGAPLAIIRTEGDVIPAKVPAKSSPEPVAAIAPVNLPIDKAPESSEEKRVKASPAARRRAKEMGIDLFTLATAEDVVHLSQVESSAPTEPKSETSGMRQAIAHAMSRSNAEIPHYYLGTSINMTPALHWLDEENKKRNIQERILPAALLIRAVVLSLKSVPELNGFWEDDTSHLKTEINPGIAIALRHEGLITPALLNAETMNLDQTMRSLDDLITRTRAGKLRNTEITRQTITITNLGDLGVESVYGVIYPPQVALVGFGRIIDAPWAEGDALCVRKVMKATLSGDHRATDGRTGAKFLEKLNDLLQHPEELL